MFLRKINLLTEFSLHHHHRGSGDSIQFEPSGGSCRNSFFCGDAVCNKMVLTVISVNGNSCLSFVKVERLTKFKYLNQNYHKNGVNNSAVA